MNIERIEAHDFGSWHELDLVIEPGVSLISGSNGSGKSTVLRACEFALFGVSQDAGRLIRRGTDRASVIVDVSTEGGPLTIERSIRASGTTAKVGLKVWGAEVELTCATVSETQALLDRMLGVTRETLRASAWSMQGDAAAFTEAKASERKKILVDTLPQLAIYPPLHEQAKAEQRDARAIAAAAQVRVDQLAGAEGRLTAVFHAMDDARAAKMHADDAEVRAELEATRLATEAESAREARRKHAAAVDTAERARADHTRATQERAAADEALARAKEAAANAPSVEAARSDAHDADVQLGNIEAEQAALREASTAWHELYATAERDLANHERARDANNEALAGYERALRSEDETGDCSRCGQSLAATNVIAEARTQIASATLDLERAQEAVVAARSRIEHLKTNSGTAPDDAKLRIFQRRALEAQSALARAESVESLAGSIDAAQQRARDAMDRESETAAQVRITRHAVDGTRETIDITEAPERTHNLAQETLSAARQAHREAAAALARAEAAAQQAERDAAAEAEARASLATAQRDVAIAEVLANGFGPMGVPALVIDSVLGQMADTWNRVLRDIGSRQRIDLRSQRLTQKGDIVDALEIIVLDGVHDASYETLSGGERTRVSVAGRIALTELLAQKKGARVRVLVLDEPSHLDKEGSEQLAAVLNEFIAAGLLDRILLITHDEALSDLIDRTIRIEKVDGVSQIAGAPTPQFPSGDPAQHAEVS